VVAEAEVAPDGQTEGLAPLVVVPDMDAKPADAQAVSTAKVPMPPPPVVAPPVPTTAPAEEKTEEEGDEAMEDMLGVFVDEEAMARYDALLKDVDPVSADDLAELAKRLEAQLAARRGARDDS
jgi:hypothetical protein